MLNALFKVLMDIFKDPETLLLVLFSLAAAVFIYKEIKAGLSTYRDSTVVRLDKTLEIYGALETNILLSLRNASPENEKSLVEKIGTAYAYMSPRLFEAMTHYLRYLNREQLEICLGIIQEETPKLRGKYKEKIPDVHNTFDDIFYYFYVTNMAFKPLFITIVNIIFISLIFAMNSYIGTLPEQNKFPAVINFVVLAISAMFIFILIRYKEFRRESDWFAKLYPFLFWFVLIPKLWIGKVIVLLLILVVSLNFSNKNRKRDNDIWKKGFYR